MRILVYQGSTLPIRWTLGQQLSVSEIASQETLQRHSMVVINTRGLRPQSNLEDLFNDRLGRVHFLNILLNITKALS